MQIERGFIERRQVDRTLSQIDMVKTHKWLGNWGVLWPLAVINGKMYVMTGSYQGNDCVQAIQYLTKIAASIDTSDAVYRLGHYITINPKRYLSERDPNRVGFWRLIGSESELGQRVILRGGNNG